MFRGYGFRHNSDPEVMAAAPVVEVLDMALDFSQLKGVGVNLPRGFAEDMVMLSHNLFHFKYPVIQSVYVKSQFCNGG